DAGLCGRHEGAEEGIPHAHRRWMTTIHRRQAKTWPNRSAAASRSRKRRRALRLMLRRSSAAVATSRAGHRTPRSDLEVLHRRWDLGQVMRLGPEVLKAQVLRASDKNR